MTVEQLIPVLVLASMLIGLGIMHQKAIGRIAALEKRSNHHGFKINGLYARARKARHNIGNMWMRLNGLDGNENKPDWDITESNMQRLAEDELNGDIY